jgi:hypothetical protein
MILTRRSAMMLLAGLSLSASVRAQASIVALYHIEPAAKAAGFEKE